MLRSGYDVWQLKSPLWGGRSGARLQGSDMGLRVPLGLATWKAVERTVGRNHAPTGEARGPGGSA